MSGEFPKITDTERAARTPQERAWSRLSEFVVGEQVGSPKLLALADAVALRHAEQGVTIPKIIYRQPARIEDELAVLTIRETIRTRKVSPGCSIYTPTFEQQYAIHSGGTVLGAYMGIPSPEETGGSENQGIYLGAQLLIADLEKISTMLEQGQPLAQEE